MESGSKDESTVTIVITPSAEQLAVLRRAAQEGGETLEKFVLRSALGAADLQRELFPDGLPDRLKGFTKPDPDSKPDQSE